VQTLLRQTCLQRQHQQSFPPTMASSLATLTLLLKLWPSLAFLILRLRAQKLHPSVPILMRSEHP
jgi:hypothetical protein